MSDDKSQPGTGRARGRARGRAQPMSMPESHIQTMQQMRISTGGDDGNGNGNGNGNGSGNGNGNGSNGNGSNGNGNGEGAALRGRGGYRGAQELDTRPVNVASYYAEGGRLVKVESNYFRLNTPTQVVVNNYDVKFEPSIESPKLRRAMIFGLRENLFCFTKGFVFDGMSNIKAIDLNKNEMVHAVKNPALPDQDVKITLNWTEEVPWGSPEMMRLYNTQMRRNMQHLAFVLMGRNYFDLKTKRTIPEHQIELLQGVITAINQHDGGLLMVVDTATKFIRAKTVLAVMFDLKQRGGNWMEEAKRQICNSIVMTTYNNKTYKIDDIITDKNPETQTFVRGGQVTNLVDYYKEHYNITITQPKQPLLVCLPSLRDKKAGRLDPCILVPELCQLTGLTDQMRQDFNLMKKIGDVSRLKPDDRCRNLNEFINRVMSNQTVKDEMSRFDLTFDKELVTVPARELVGEKIYMGNDTDDSAITYNQKSADFSKEMRSKRMHKAVSIAKWMIIVPNRMQSFVENFTSTLNKVANPMGINLGRPRVEVIGDDRPGSYVNAIAKLKGSPCEMVVTLVPNNNSERYNAIKKCCYIDIGMASQVIVQRTLSKPPQMMSVCTKIMIQMAAKVGAEPWALKIPPKGLVVVGYDTYHDTMDRKRSVGGFCCSLNDTLTAWYSRVAFHSDKEEMSSNFAQNLAEGLKRYYDVNGNTLPKKILIYRDGVSEGDIKHVYEFELAQVQNVLDKMFGNAAPTYAFIIVTKRVNARFFLAEGRGRDNPIPGTIIDRVVTREKRYDFYLISQSVRQGTVTPTMYNIIYDKSGFQASHHQQLAYKLCHLYYNWQGTIRVPAPCQYAHKLAFLVGNSLHRDPHISLADRLFYL